MALQRGTKHQTDLIHLNTPKNSASQRWSHRPLIQTFILSHGEKRTPLRLELVKSFLWAKQWYNEWVRKKHRRTTYPIHTQTAGQWKLLKSIDSNMRIKNIYCTSLSSDFEPNHVKMHLPVIHQQADKPWTFWISSSSPATFLNLLNLHLVPTKSTLINPSIWLSFRCNGGNPVSP